MLGWLGGAYIWVKAAHVVIVFFWIAGLFMLPRYLAYQAEYAPGSAEDLKWAQRTGSLRRIILTPSLVATWVLGMSLALSYGFEGSGWLHAKITLVLLLSGYHGWAVGAARKMAAGGRPYSTRTLRLLNEVPALLTIGIVVLVITKLF
jgi:putative membrane protein